MQTIEPFMKLGWHTVPLAGELKRLENGKKTLPKFENGWKDQYTREFNNKVTPLGGTITGKCSGIIAIDCDNTVTYDLFKQLDPEYKFHFISKGKLDTAGRLLNSGTIIYKYIDRITESYNLHNTIMSLDFYSDGGFIYLPTIANQTKESFKLCDIKEPPEAILALIQSLKPIKIPRAEAAISSKTWTNHLAPQIERFTTTKKIMPELFKIITPRDFRTMDEYLSKGYIVPNDIPDGRGSEYMSKVSAILGADESVSIELYAEAIAILNNMFSSPIPKARLESTIIDPMVEEKASIDGVPIWRYNENWKASRFTAVTKRNSLVEGFYDPNRMHYYLADIVNEDVKSFKSDYDFYGYINIVTVNPPDQGEIREILPLVDAVSTPAHPFGFYGEDHEQMFNTFVPSPALTVFREPQTWAKNYTRPTTIISYLQSLIPDNYMRNYLLRFLRRKFDTFEYSPTILYFLGVSGAGKDTLVSIIEKIIGSNSLARPTTKEFLEMYNGWMLDKYIVQLDEYGNQLNKFDEREAALGKIKAYTGKPQVQIRQMRTDGYNYMHNITFIMTANKNPLMLDADDRRVAIFNCPVKLADESWVQSAGGMAIVYNRIQSEVNDFAYYLATEIDSATIDEYMEPPETLDKKILIASKFSAGNKIAFLLHSGMYTELEKITRELDVKNVFNGCGDGRIYEDDLFELYDEMTEGKGTKRGLAAAMKEFTKVPTTYKGAKAYYYHVPGIKGYKPSAFTAIESEGNINHVLNI